MTNKCWPTCLPTVLANKSLLLCSKSWPTMLAIYELFVFCWPTSGKPCSVCRDWLAVVNIMMQNGWMHLTLTNYTSPFYLCIIHDCTQTDFRHLRFRLQAIKQITDAAMSSSSARVRHLRHTVVQQNVVVCDTSICQQLLANKC